MATYGGQNVGAKKMDRVDAGLKACIKLGIAYAILAFVFILLFGKNLALLFLDAKETEIIKLVYYFLLGNSGAYILLALVNIVRFMIQGLGYSAFAVIAGICEMVARTIAGFILVPKIRLCLCSTRQSARMDICRYLPDSCLYLCCKTSSPQVRSGDPRRC